MPQMKALKRQYIMQPSTLSGNLSSKKKERKAAQGIHNRWKALPDYSNDKPPRFRPCPASLPGKWSEYHLRGILGAACERALFRPTHSQKEVASVSKAKQNTLFVLQWRGIAHSGTKKFSAPDDSLSNFSTPKRISARSIICKFSVMVCHQGWVTFGQCLSD